jgi:sigma-B regulation protein RsbQ
MDVVRRNNVVVSGRADGQPMVFAHGFGCDQNMWRHVAPEFEQTHKVVLFDHVGAGASDLTAYDEDRYSTLQGYADDIVEILEALDLEGTIFVGHSVASMMGVLAAKKAPRRFSALVLVGPSPRYLDDDTTDYRGGFKQEDIDGLLESLDANYLGWSAAMAPAIVGNPDKPELGEELTASFCRTDPEIQRRFARATFLSDNRDDLQGITIPTLVLQCSDDIIAPDEVGEYVHKAIPTSTFRKLQATGHCPNLSAPAETADAIRSFLQQTVPA